jgi:hypothetical protein
MDERGPKEPRFGCASELSGWLHRRFQEELGGKCCAMLRPFYQKADPGHTCSYLYQKGAEMAVEVALSAPALATPLPSTFDTDPSHRWTDRLFARLGLLEDAAPLFGSALAVPRAGVLLAGCSTKKTVEPIKFNDAAPDGPVLKAGLDRLQVSGLAPASCPCLDDRFFKIS